MSKHLPWRRVAVLVAVISCANAAAAQTPDPSATPGVLTLEELMSAEIRSVFGASRFLQPVLDAPASVSIVTAEEIERLGYRTLADILRGVRGLYVNYDRSYSYVGVRGWARPGDYNTRVLVLVDGHRLNENVYDHAAIGSEFPIDVALIERLEVVRGPFSTLYGTNALLAVVNIVTRRGTELPRGSGTVEAGSLGTIRGRATAAGALGTAGDFVLSATASFSDGESDLRWPGGVRSHPDLDGEGLGQLFASVRYGRWTAQGVVAQREKGIPTGAFGARLDLPGSETFDVRGWGNLQYLGDWRGTSVRARAAYDRYRYDGQYVYDEGPQQDFGHGNWWSTELSGVRRLSQSHLVTAGVELRGNLRQDQRVWDLSGVLLDDRRESFVWSLYAQDEIRVAPRLTVNASAGYDRYPTFGGAVTYRGAAIVKPSSNHAVKLIYGTAFRAPNAYELYYYSSGAGHTPHLGPERVRTMEAGWERYFPGAFRMSASVFKNRVSDVIARTIAPDNLFGLGFENAGEVRATGLGIEAEGMLGPVHTFGTYTFGDVEEAGNPRPANSPRHLGSFRLMAPLFNDALSVAAEWRYVSERVTVAGDQLAGVATTDVTLLSREIRRGVRVGLTARNLLGVRYAEPGAGEHPYPAIPQDGRTILLRLTWRL